MNIVRRIELKNFRCHDEFSLNCDRPTTLIIGENGSGKSTLSKMLFSIIKAVASIAQETDSSVRVLLEKYAT